LAKWRLREHLSASADYSLPAAEIAKTFCAKKTDRALPRRQNRLKEAHVATAAASLCCFAAATCALFLPVAWSGFIVYDDSLYVTEQPIVQAG